MARSITFNGVTRFSPGGITRINAEALAQITLGDNSIVGLIGEAEGGAPGAEGGLVTLFDPSRASDLYKSGPIVDALNLAFQSSNDPDVPGGASRVYVYKTNNSTQASLSLPAAPGEFLAPADGNLKILPSADSGSTSTIVDSNLGLTYTRDDELIGAVVVYRPFTANAEVTFVTDYEAGSNVLTVSPTIVAPVGGEEYIIFRNQAESVNVATSGTSTTVVDSAASFTVDDIGRWVHIQNTDGVSYLRQITDNDATTLTFSPSLGQPVAVGAYFQILGNAIDITSADWGLHTNSITVDFDAGVSARSTVATVEFEGEEEVSADLGGKIYLKVLYKGGSAAVSDTVKVASTPLTTTSFQLTTGALTPGAHVGQQVLVNGEYTVITGNTADLLVVSPALSEAPVAGDDVEIQTVTGGYMEIQGSAGVATTFVAKTYGVSDDLTIVFPNNMTLRQLIAAIQQNSNYLAVPASGVNLDTTLVKDFDFGPNTRTSHAGILVSPSLFTPLTGEGATRDLMAVVEYFNDFSEFVNAARSSDSGSSVSGSGAVLPTPIATALTGGSRGVSTNQNFQDGFDELLLVRCNSVVPLIDQNLVTEGFGSSATVASVAAQAAAHCAAARGAAQSTAGERGAFVGFRGTKTEVITQANALNDQDVALVCQNPTALDRTGTLVEFGPRMLAVMAASMRAGVVEVAEPLTHKLLRVAGITQDASWDPTDVTDANEMIIGGVLFAESIDGVGTRWVRDLTTWVASDNLAFSEGSVRDAVRYVAFGLRTTLEERFTGKKATPATIANVKDAASSWLELVRQDNIIVDSTDPTTGATIKAYHNLKVTSSGDTAKINVGIFPVPGINFQLTDIYLQLPTQSA